MARHDAQPAEIAIVGAGLAGVACAQRLRAAGVHAPVFEKSRGIGGRVATRRFETQAFDYGAPQLEICSAPFQAAIAPHAALTSTTLAAPSSGLRTIVKQLATGITVELTTQVAALGFHDDRVVVTLQDGRAMHYDRVVVTAPLPQALMLVPDKARHMLDPSVLTRLLAVTYSRSVVVSLAVPLHQQVIDAATLAQNRFIGSLATRVGLHGQTWVAQLHPNHVDVAYEKTDTELVAAITAELAIDGASFAPLEFHVHRWRYARVDNPLADACVAVGSKQQLIFAGDAFHAVVAPGTTDAAWMSGLAAAELVLTT